MDGRLIFCKFLDKDGNSNTYCTSIDVQEGDFVEAEADMCRQSSEELR